MAARKTLNNAEQSSVVRGFVALLVLAFIVYAPALRGNFIWDDGPMVFGNPFVQSPGGLASIWAGRDVDYYPVTSTLFWIEWRCFGAHPAGYRIVSILLHVGSSVLIWRILKQLKAPGAAIAGAIFCVHPVCVETVAWIAESKNTLSVFFTLLSLLLFLRARPTAENRKDAPEWNAMSYTLSIIVFVVALLSKISVVMFPFVLLAMVEWRKRAQLARVAPYFAASLGLGLLNIWFHHHHAMSAGESAEAEPLAARVAGGGYAIWFYLAKIVAPINLMPIYPKWDVGGKSVLNWLPLALWIAGLIVLWFWSRKNFAARTVFLGLAFFSIVAIPVLGFVSISYLAHSQVSDHLQYFPMIGVVAAAGGLIHRLKNATTRDTLSIGILGAFVVLSFQQAQLYGEPEKLWRNNVAKNPNAAMAWGNLAEIAAARNDLNEAVRCYRESLRLDPGNLNVRETLGQVLMSAGRGDEAAVEFRDVIARDANRPRAHNNLGVLLFSSGQVADAMKEFEAVTRLMPDNEAAHVNLGFILERFNRYDDAIGEFQKALQINPQNSRAREGLLQAQQAKSALPR